MPRPSAGAGVRLLVAAVLIVITGVAELPSHAAPALPCAKVTGRFQALEVGAFSAGSSSITALAVDPTGPERVYVTNGKQIRATQDGGCDWTTVFTAPQGSITSLSTAFAPRVQAVLDTGRPRLFYSLGGLSPFTEGGDGLPVAGQPVQLSASRGRQIDWLLLRPAIAGGSGGGGVNLPVLGQPPAPTGSLSAPLFTSSDGGAHWQSTGSGTQLDAIQADDGSDLVLWGIQGGNLVLSQDGAKTFHSMNVSGVSAINPAGPGRVVVATGSSIALVTAQHVERIPLGSHVRSVAVRGEDPQVALASTDNGYVLIDLTAKQHASVPAPGVARVSLLVADASPSEGAYIGAIGHRVLRWVDDAPTVILNTGHVGPVRLEAASLSPAVNEVRMPIGTSGTVNLNLHLPPNPTPVDLMFLFDISYSMDPALAELKDGLLQAARQLIADGVDLRLGLGTIGTQSKSHGPDPEFDPLTPGYRKPVVYHLIDPISSPDIVVRDLQSVSIEERDRAHQSDERISGGAAAIEQVLTGSGIKDPYTRNLLYAVPKGQVPHWRGGSARKVLAVITGSPIPDNEGPAMGDPVGGLPELITGLRAQGIKTIGLTPRQDDATLASLRELAEGTGAVAARGPVDCDGDGIPNIALGGPLACSSVTGLPSVVVAAVESLRDFQPVAVLGQGVAKPLPLGVSSLDAFQTHNLPVPVSVSCGSTPSVHHGSVVAQFRHEAVAEASIVVTCFSPAVPAIVVPPPIQPEPAPVAAFNPPAPPANPAQQVQNQPQINPQPGAAAQSEEEQEVATATNEVEDNATFASANASDDEKPWVLGMSLATVSFVGLAVLRHRRRTQLAVSHVRNI